ncbi:hypothetical protein BAUCODRAFT_37112 [Baudoinia panamericana UAMH 10762]|uniref:Uncharacterized protein n=1 Tax=Baudoinia panamericana (strain UAMH 10762) TaxID=717646 RepID=M2MAD7_BAUPA|nr:uncharacterized protein BAUCODRAFT_37112 [Baudoinia panamericana UAMH 10762]EMC93436.1 hypothetical protein BAUCODRAFT_37112 [Baudoinia panamericana UAMH 10762]
MTINLRDFGIMDDGENEVRPGCVRRMNSRQPATTGAWMQPLLLQYWNPSKP